jgi:hypothetical protein
MLVLKKQAPQYWVILDTDEVIGHEKNGSEIFHEVAHARTEKEIRVIWNNIFA